MKDSFKFIGDIILPFLCVISGGIFLITEIKDYNDLYSSISFISTLLLIPTYIVYKYKYKKRQKDIDDLRKIVDSNDNYETDINYLKLLNKIRNETEDTIELGNYLTGYCPKCNMIVPVKLKFKWILLSFGMVILAFFSPIPLILLFILLANLYPFITNFVLLILVISIALPIFLINKTIQYINDNQNNPKYIKRFKCPICDK